MATIDDDDNDDDDNDEKRDRGGGHDAFGNMLRHQNIRDILACRHTEGPLFELISKAHHSEYHMISKMCVA